MEKGKQIDKCIDKDKICMRKAKKQKLHMYPQKQKNGHKEHEAIIEDTQESLEKINETLTYIDK